MRRGDRRGRQRCRTDRGILADALDDTRITGAWPIYAEQIRGHGIRAVFVFPATQPGWTSPQPGLVMCVYRDRPGALSEADLSTVRANHMKGSPRPAEHAGSVWSVDSFRNGLAPLVPCPARGQEPPRMRPRHGYRVLPGHEAALCDGCGYVIMQAALIRETGEEVRAVEGVLCVVTIEPEA